MDVFVIKDSFIRKNEKQDFESFSKTLRDIFNKITTFTNI